MATQARVLTLYRHEELLALLLYVHRTEIAFGVSARSCEMPGSYLIAYHREVISTIDPQIVIERFVRSCGGRSDLLVLPNIVKIGRTAQAARNVANQYGLRTICQPGHASPISQ